MSTDFRVTCQNHGIQFLICGLLLLLLLLMLRGTFNIVIFYNSLCELIYIFTQNL